MVKESLRENNLITINDAVIKGRLDVVYLLYKEGLDINERCVTDLSTPLMNSILYGYDLITIYLIKNGADLNVYDKNGFNLLMLSIIAGNEWIASILIEYGLDVNIQQNDGITALMMASSLGLIHTVYRLITSGANLNIRNYAGETALVNAIQERNDNVIELLKNYGAIE